MATKNFRSTVLEPTSEFAHGDRLRFTALATVGEVLKGSFSEATIGEDGIYSIDLQYGKYRIDYKPYEGVWRHFADVEVNADTLATTLQDLALASVPVTDETILVLQGILADAEAAKTESAAIRDEAAASAAAAAEDAAKLADIKPSDIGAVDNMSELLWIKPSESFFDILSGTPDDRLLKIKVPANLTGKFLSLHIKLYSRDVACPSDIFITTYLYPDAYVFSGNKASAVGGLGDLSVKYCYSSEEGLYLILDKSFYTTRFHIFSVMSMGSVDPAWLGEKWEMSLITDADIVAEHVKETIVIACDNQSSVSTLPVVRSITYDNNSYQNVDSLLAKELEIPDKIFEAALAEQQADDLFKSEKSIALQIMADFNLGTGEHEVTGSDIADVRAYIQSIDPSKGLKSGHLQRAKIPRPSIFDRYKTNPYEI